MTGLLGRHHRRVPLRFSATTVLEMTRFSDSYKPYRQPHCMNQFYRQFNRNILGHVSYIHGACTTNLTRLYRDDALKIRPETDRVLGVPGHPNCRSSTHHSFVVRACSFIFLVIVSLALSIPCTDSPMALRRTLIVFWHIPKTGWSTIGAVARKECCAG